MSSIKLKQRTGSMTIKKRSGSIKLKERTGRIEETNIKYSFEALKYRDRVELNGGEIIDLDWIDLCLSTLKKAGIYDDLGLLVDANFGVKKDGSGNVSKLYDLSPNGNDPIQQDEAMQPTFEPEAGFNNKKVCVFDGTDDFFQFSEIDSLFVCGVVKVNVHNDFNYLVNKGSQDYALRTDYSSYRFYPGPADYHYDGYIQVNNSTTDLSAENPHIVYAEPDSAQLLSRIASGYGYHGRKWGGPIVSIAIGKERLNESQRESIIELFNSYYEVFAT